MFEFLIYIFYEKRNFCFRFFLSINITPDENIDWICAELKRVSKEREREGEERDNNDDDDDGDDCYEWRKG